MKTLIIIPTLNEQGNIGRLLEKLSMIVPYVDILVVDDQSKDRTHEEVQEQKRINPRIELLIRSDDHGF